MMRSVATMLLIAASTQVSAAQNPKRIEQWDNLGRLAKGTEIRVTLGSGKSVRGFLQQITADSLVINGPTSQESLSRPDIRRVGEKRPSHRGRNTLIGLGIGTAGGLAVGAGIDIKMNDDWFPNAGKAVFAPVGAIIGTVVGVAIPTGGWRDVYRAPARN